ncbi:MAG: PAS domain-containing protein [Bacteroidetes bacterium]|nr:PAS domain-containing protein [Bacteroidota bacterium]
MATKSTPEQQQTNSKTTAPEYVVGLGASAGGLEALQDFFKAVPHNTGLAFVVIQHLSPDFKSMMDELLARYTKLPIRITTDGMQVEPDTIYLIPPRKNLTIFHGKLLLEDQGARNGLNLPIDLFFKSLALDYGKKAIGVVLSGTGSDGSLGTRAIKEAGGMVMAQDERTAKFDGMPRSAIKTGLVDYILPPGKMPQAIVDYIKHPFVHSSDDEGFLIPGSGDTLSKVLMTLRDHTGTDFSYYKENTIIRRLERRVSINRLNNLDDYLKFLTENEKEKDILYRELLIGVTRFFRDEEAFNLLFNQLSDSLLSLNPRSLRVWSVGCSTGEEMYSLAMMFSEAIEQKRLNTEVKIFATDIDKRSLEVAGQGLYPESMVSDVEAPLLAKYFSRRENGYQVNENIRKMVIFATHNVLKDPPFSKLDLVVCRNLLIYLKPESQDKVISSFYMSLKTRGLLFLGSSESLGTHADAFDVVSSKHKIYTKRPGYQLANFLDLDISRKHSLNALSSREPRRKGQTNDVILSRILENFVPPSIVIDENLNVLQVINDINPYLSLRTGKFSQNLSGLVSPELQMIINNVVRRIKKGSQKVVFEGVKIKKEDLSLIFDIVGYHLMSDDEVHHFLISFIHNTLDNYKKDDQDVVNLEDQYQNRLTELQHELQFTKENLQATIEELETSNEELQASNEELIASNEELQSTNEELQSVNEELYTVNSEYQKKIEELIQLNNDVNNLLNNTNVGALYLDNKLCIRKFTPNLSDITNLLDNDIGRPVFHITGVNLYPEFFDHIRQVQKNLQVIESEKKLSDGKLYLVRISPYRTDFHAVDGILVTLVNISILEAERRKLQLTTTRLNDALELGNMAWWEWDIPSGKVYMHEKKATMLGYSLEEFPTDVYEICKLIHPDDYEQTMQHMRDYFAGKVPAYDIAYRIRTKDGDYKIYHDRGGVVEWSSDGKPLRLIGLVIDITRLKAPNE